MAYETCENCGSRIFNLGCVNCNEPDYIGEQDAYTLHKNTKEHIDKVYGYEYEKWKETQ